MSNFFFPPMNYQVERKKKTYYLIKYKHSMMDKSFFFFFFIKIETRKRDSIMKESYHKHVDTHYLQCEYITHSKAFTS